MINPDNAGSPGSAGGRPDRGPRVAGRLNPRQEVLLATVADIAGTEATPRTPSLVEEFGSATRMLGAVIRNTANPRCSAPATRSTSSPPRRPPTSTAASCPGFEDEFFATLAELVRRGIEIDYVSNRTPGRRRTTARWSTR